MKNPILWYAHCGALISIAMTFLTLVNSLSADLWPLLAAVAVFLQIGQYLFTHTKTALWGKITVFALYLFSMGMSYSFGMHAIHETNQTATRQALESRVDELGRALRGERELVDQLLAVNHVTHARELQARSTLVEDLAKARQNLANHRTTMLAELPGWLTHGVVLLLAALLELLILCAYTTLRAPERRSEPVCAPDAVLSRPEAPASAAPALPPSGGVFLPGFSSGDPVSVKIVRMKLKCTEREARSRLKSARDAGLLIGVSKNQALR